MKKTIIALATAAVFATSANAATVYEKDGAKVEVGGSVRVLLTKEKAKRADLKNDGSRLEVKASQDLGNGLSALGGLEVRFDGDDTDEETGKFGNPTTNKLFAGLAYEGVGTLTFGKQATNGDDVQLNDNAYVWGGNNNLLDSADKSIKFRSAEWSGFSFGLDYVFGDAEKKNYVFEEPYDKYNLEYGDKYAYQSSLFYTRGLAKDLTLNLAAGYGVEKLDLETTKTAYQNTSWRTAAQLVYGPVSFGAEYGQTISKDNDVKATTAQHLLVSASYQVIEPSKLYVQWKNVRIKEHLDSYNLIGANAELVEVHVLPNAKTKVDTLIVGADYKLHKNVVTYVEYAYEKAKEQSSGSYTSNGNDWTPFSRTNTTKDNKVGVGLRVFF
ncbi:porin [Bisgaard Taxon 46]